MGEQRPLGVGYDCIYWEGRVLLLKDGDGRHHKKCEDNNGDLFIINDQGEFLWCFPSSMLYKRLRF